ncbi:MULTISPECIES: cytochrome C oxidase subunit IV family protein [Sphingobium]|uniref:cytochrome C oxidase subunit IV family protein n=1 Tax=Sphingobium TaxID=165695 RepID=UPI000834D90F|nr:MULTISPECIES: cytochrome C oxidase subunit IV family protein [Sphingobium]
MTHSIRLTGIWALLIAVSLASFLMAEYHHARMLAVAVVMAIAGFKVRLVLYHFMDLGTVPPGFRWFFNCWVITCSVMIFGIYWYTAKMIA